MLKVFQYYNFNSLASTLFFLCNSGTHKLSGASVVVVMQVVTLLIPLTYKEIPRGESLQHSQRSSKILRICELIKDAPDVSEPSWSLFKLSQIQ
jgi:hypothetical protein